MNEEHSCCLGQTEILDPFGATVARFLRLCSGNYYGGLTAQPPSDDTIVKPVIRGPHILYHLTGLLTAIGQITLAAERADMPRMYQLRGQYGKGLFGAVQLERVMDARPIAWALGCDEQDIHDTYEYMITVREDEHEHVD